MICAPRTPRQDDDSDVDDENTCTNIMSTQNVFSCTPRQDDDYQDNFGGRRNLDCTQLQSSPEYGTSTQLQTPPVTSSMCFTQVQSSPESECTPVPSTAASANLMSSTTVSPVRLADLCVSMKSELPQTPVQVETDDGSDEDDDGCGGVNVDIDDRESAEVKEGGEGAGGEVESGIDSDASTVCDDGDVKANADKVDDDDQSVHVMSQSFDIGVDNDHGDYDDYGDYGEAWTEDERSRTDFPHAMTQELSELDDDVQQCDEDRMDAMLKMDDENTVLQQRRGKNNVDASPTMDSNMQQWIASIKNQKNKKEDKKKKKKKKKKNKERKEKKKQHYVVTDEDDIDDEEDSIRNFSPTPEKNRSRNRQGQAAKQTTFSCDDGASSDEIDTFGSSDDDDDRTSCRSRKTTSSPFTSSTSSVALKTTRSLSLFVASPTIKRNHYQQNKIVRWMMVREGKKAKRSSKSRHSSSELPVQLSGGIVVDGTERTMFALHQLMVLTRSADKKKNCGGTLVVCSPTNVDRICSAIRKWTTLVPLAYHGPRRGHKISENAWNLTKYDVVVTSHRMLTTDECKGKKMLQEIRNVKEMNVKQKVYGWISRSKDKKERGEKEEEEEEEKEEKQQEREEKGRKKKKDKNRKWDASLILKRDKESKKTSEATLTQDEVSDSERRCIDEIDIERAKDDGRSRLHCVEWTRVVVDDAHELKTNKTKRWKCLNSLLSQHRWAMTSKPLVDTSGSRRRRTTTDPLRTVLAWIAGASSSSSETLLIDSEIEMTVASGIMFLPKRNTVMLTRTDEDVDEDTK